jgi:hypothetical protein
MPIPGARRRAWSLRDCRRAVTVIAFAEMIAAGAGVEDVAVCFGITPLTVQRRLKLAKVSPTLFELFRKDKINLDQLMALAITDDHAAQERVWNTTPAYNRTSPIPTRLSGVHSVARGTHARARGRGMRQSSQPQRRTPDAERCADHESAEQGREPGPNCRAVKFDLPGDVSHRRRELIGKRQRRRFLHCLAVVGQGLRRRGRRATFDVVGQGLLCRVGACARLGVDAVRYSFIAVDLHHLLLAGLPAHHFGLEAAPLLTSAAPVDKAQRT